MHPSYLLRMPDEADKRRAYEDFVGDLRRIHDMAVRRRSQLARGTGAIMCGRA